MKAHSEWLVKFVLHEDVAQHRADGWSGETYLAHHSRYAVLMERHGETPEAVEA